MFTNVFGLPACCHRMTEANPMLFPMYTVAADVLMKMTKVEPHERLKALSKFGIEHRALAKARVAMASCESQLVETSNKDLHACWT